jgi:hypothetical protein
MKIRVIFLFIALLATSLLALDYELKTVKVMPIESYPAQATLGGVTIAADPYDTNEKSFTAFDIKNLNSRGYFPLHVIIRNGSKNFFKIRTVNVILIASSGQQLYTTPATVVVDDVVKSGLTSRIPLIKSQDPTTSKRAGSPLSDFTGKELTNRIIDPGAISDGFLFFYTPNPKKNLFAGSTLYIPKLEEEGADKTLGPFFIPLNPALSPSK